MPEGDSYARAAAKLRPALEGKTIEAIDGGPTVRAKGDRFVDRRIESVRTHGKHLLIDVDNGLTIHLRLAMPGRIRVTAFGGRTTSEGERSGGHVDAGAVRLRIRTATHEVVCYSAPTVEVERRKVIDGALRRLGPDVLDDEFDYDAYRHRASLLPADTMLADFLLDQRIMSGVGNEYKNEILFLERLHPRASLAQLDPVAVDALAERARKLMIPNARRKGPRVTTGYRARDLDAWVYDRSGQPCRRCNTTIVSDHIGARFQRITYWCPRCQPEPSGARAEQQA